MLMILEIALVSVTVIIAILALWGARSIKQGAENAARVSARKVAEAEVDKRLEQSQISDIIKAHAEKVGEKLSRQARGDDASAQSGDANTKEGKDA